MLCAFFSTFAVWLFYDKMTTNSVAKNTTMKIKLSLLFLTLTLSVFIKADPNLPSTSNPEECYKIPDLIEFFNSYSTLSEEGIEPLIPNSDLLTSLSERLSLDSMPDSLPNRKSAHHLAFWHSWLTFSLWYRRRRAIWRHYPHTILWHCARGHLPTWWLWSLHRHHTRQRTWINYGTLLTHIGQRGRPSRSGSTRRSWW